MTTRLALPTTRLALPATLLAALVAGALAAPVAAAGDGLAPLVGQPAIGLTSGATITGAGIAVRASWHAQDPSGIASQQVQVSIDGGSWQTVARPSGSARSAIIRVPSPHEAMVRVRATDTGGNTSAWQSGPAFRVRQLSQATSGVTTTGAWSTVRSRSFLGGTALRSTDAGARVTFTFTGVEVGWIGRRAPSGGRVVPTLDTSRGVTVSTRSATVADRRVLAVTGPTPQGPHTFSLRLAGGGTAWVDGFIVIDVPPVDPVLVGAGDIAACGLTGDSRTAKLLDGIAGRIFAAGDTVYPTGSARQYRDCYGPTWGRWRLRTSPVPGNHEYYTSGASAYYAYFGSRAGTAGKGWYAYDLGTWRVYNLNANCSIVGCGTGSEQVAWLAADLATHPRACVAGVWHQPRFSSGFHGNDGSVSTLWRTLEDAGADVVLNGHDHDYERFAAQRSDGTADPAGITEFVVGTGGAALRPFETLRANSLVRNSTALGVLKLTLHPGGYDFRFVPVAGATFTDAGSGTCH